MEIELRPAVSPLERYLQRLGRPTGDAGRCHQQQSQSSKLQDPLHQRQLLSHPQPVGPQCHRAGCAPANTFFQLMTILEENHHSFLIVEHDPRLGEADGMIQRPYNVGMRCMISAQSPPTAFLMSSLASLKAGAGITACIIRIMFSRSSFPIKGNIHATNSGNLSWGI